MDGKINGPQRSLEGGGARGRKGEKGNEGWKGREGRGERGGCCGKQGLLEGVVARHLGYLLHLRFGISSPQEDHGQCKASPSCTAWSQGTAVPRASIRLVPLHAKHCPCSTDEGPKSVPWGPPLQQHCWFPWKPLPVTQMEYLVPTVRRNPQSPQAFGMKTPITLFFP